MTKSLKQQIRKPLTPPKAFFKWCESQIPVYHWSNKSETIKSSERMDCKVIKKRLTKKSRLTMPTKFYPFAIILVSKNRIEIQSHDYWLDIEDGKETLTMRLTNFERFSDGQHLKANAYYTYWEKGLLPNYGYMSGAYTNTRFFDNAWQSKLKNNRDMKYLKLPKLNRTDISRVYRYRQEIEYLQSIGATNLENEVLFGGGCSLSGGNYSRVDMRIINKKWLKANKHLLKTKNQSFNDIMIDSLLKKRKAKRFTSIDISQHLHYTQLNQLPKEVNLTKFQEWFYYQSKSFEYYMDYLKMLEQLKIPLNDSNVTMSKNLKTAHDNAVAMIEQIKIEERLKKVKQDEVTFNKRLKQLSKLETEIDDFVFLIPKDLQEIIQEGSSLHHCVGSQHYLEDHLKGKTNIVFVRQKQDTSKPFFTLEYKNKKVVQIQGKYNCEEVPKTLQKAVDKWQTEIKNAV